MTRHQGQAAGAAAGTVAGLAGGGVGAGAGPGAGVGAGAVATAEFRFDLGVTISAPRITALAVAAGPTARAAGAVSLLYTGTDEGWPQTSVLLGGP